MKAVQDLVGASLGMGRYRVTAVLGRGGMATVYAAEHTSLRRPVAIKVLDPRLTDQPRFVERFRLEADTIAHLEHPHILPVYDTGQEGNLLYLVMLLARDGTLKSKLRGGDPAPWSPDRVLDLARQILPALDVAHENGVVHRDIKPDNLLLHGDKVFLADFGIAKLMHSDPGLTSIGMFVGTPEYAAPEQVLGFAIDGRSDLYAFGVVLYELLVGRVPYQGTTPMGVALQHVQASLPAPIEINPNLPPAVAEVLVRALAKEPDHRYATGSEMLGALEHALLPTDRPMARAGRSGQRSKPKLGRRIWLSAGIASIVVAASLVGAFRAPGPSVDKTALVSVANGSPPATLAVANSSPPATLAVPTAVPTPAPTAIPLPGALAAPRFAFTATPLLNNRAVLVVGGRRGSAGLANVDMFDATTNRWQPATSLGTPRSNHTATLLADARLLVVGGQRDESTYLASTEAFDPATSVWSSLPEMQTPRADHTASVLPDGRVLVAGGSSNTDFLASAEIFDPRSNAWTQAAPMPTPRTHHTATVLPTGQVLVVGGFGAEGTAVRYDPRTNTWTAASPPAAARVRHTATTLPNGKVLVAGGDTTGRTLRGENVGSAELYDAATDKWTPAGTMASPHNGHTATLLPNGQVLVVGGTNASETLGVVERYEPATNQWLAAAPLTVARAQHVTSLLFDGQVLVAGGANGAQALAHVERYDTTNDRWAAAR